MHYFSLVSNDDLNARYGARLHAGPAAAKVWSVCRALQHVGEHPVIVTGLIPGAAADLLAPPQMVESHSVPVAKLATAGRRIARRLTAALSFLRYASTRVRPGDAVLLYNAFVDYIPAAIYLRLRGRPAILDLEDGPRTDERGLRGAVGRWSYLILRRLCQQRVVTVSTLLAQTLGLRRALPVYGSWTPGQVAERSHGPTLRVLFGGAILQETGVELFIGAVKRLRYTADVPIRFDVTGFYPREIGDRLRELASPDGPVPLHLHGEVLQAEYRRILESADVGLCLKLSAGSMGQTTFPSKAVEIMTSGLTLVSTSVSDIPRLFGPDQAVILREESVGELVEVLRMLALNRELCRAIGRNGQAFARERFSPQRVGKELAAFLFDEEQPA
ncbi:glycosyltransferase [Devosia sp.]|uniref:glycosyltransferase family protein n=1 Tax=Devosia sp. TaxID=1871048 RepID=UPI002616CD97|nr:glycosyltransferase [Devosia sp.]